MYSVLFFNFCTQGILQIFPNARQSGCAWHALQNVVKKLSSNLPRDNLNHVLEHIRQLISQVCSVIRSLCVIFIHMSKALWLRVDDRLNVPRLPRGSGTTTLSAISMSPPSVRKLRRVHYSTSRYVL